MTFWSGYRRANETVLHGWHQIRYIFPYNPFFVRWKIYPRHLDRWILFNLNNFHGIQSLLVGNSHIISHVVQGIYPRQKSFDWLQSIAVSFCGCNSSTWGHVLLAIYKILMISFLCLGLMNPKCQIGGVWCEHRSKAEAKRWENWSAMLKIGGIRLKWLLWWIVATLSTQHKDFSNFYHSRVK